MDSLQVAGYFKSQGLDVLKTMKLLYYAQGIHLKMFGEVLFEDDILAWKHGPVVEPAYKNWGSLPTQPPKKDVQDFLDDIITQFKKYSGVQLIDKTHGESPWRDVDQNDLITIDSMAKFFETFPEADVAEKGIEERKRRGLEDLERHIMTHPHMYSSKPPSVDLSVFLF